MLVLSMHVNRWLGGEGASPNIPILTGIFFMLNFLAATQDIAVDGWALTMLKRCNVGHASTCNSVGQTAGYFLGYVVFIALESADFCNKYMRTTPSDDGLITLPGYLLTNLFVSQKKVLIFFLYVFDTPQAFYGFGDCAS